MLVASPVKVIDLKENGIIHPTFNAEVAAVGRKHFVLQSLLTFNVIPLNHLSAVPTQFSVAVPLTTTTGANTCVVPPVPLFLGLVAAVCTGQLTQIISIFTANVTKQFRTLVLTSRYTGVESFTLLTDPLRRQ